MTTGQAGAALFRAWATVGFVASALLHLATFTSLPPARAATAALVLFAGSFVPLAAMLARLRRAGAPTRTWRGLHVFEWRALGALVPEGVRWLGFGVALYVVMNLGLSLLLGDEGAGNVRLLSGHLLLFYLVPLVYFRFVDPRREELRGPPRP